MGENHILLFLPLEYLNFVNHSGIHFASLPKLLLKEKNLYTVAVGLMSLDETEFARFAAGSVFIAVPIVVLYFFLVKDMVNGMAQGAVKG